MRGGEVCDGVLMARLVDRRGNNERVEGLKTRTRCEHGAIAQFDHVSGLPNVACRPFGDFPRLSFGRSINNQDVHDIPPTRRTFCPGLLEDPRSTLHQSPALFVLDSRFKKTINEAGETGQISELATVFAEGSMLEIGYDQSRKKLPILQSWQRNPCLRYPLHSSLSP